MKNKKGNDMKTQYGDDICCPKCSGEVITDQFDANGQPMRDSYQCGECGHTWNSEPTTANEPPTTFRVSVREWRTARGFSQNEAALAITSMIGRNVSIDTIRKWEQGRNTPTDAALIVRALREQTNNEKGNENETTIASMVDRIQGRLATTD